MSINPEDYTMEELLATINHGITTGNNMNGANFAFSLLCDKLKIDPDKLIYRPNWARKEFKYIYVPYNTPLQPGEYRKLRPTGLMYRCVDCGIHVIDQWGRDDEFPVVPEHNCKPDLNIDNHVQNRLS